MPRHQILSRLSSRFPTVWVNRVLPWQQHMKSRLLRSRLKSQSPTAPPISDFFVANPSFFHGEYFRPARLARWSQRARVLRAIKILRDEGCTRFVLYLWRPDFDYAIDILNWSMTVYHIDDEYSFTETLQAVSPREVKLIKTCDQVIVHSPGLMERKGYLNKKTALIPNGVDFESYTKHYPEPEDLANIPRPRIGYIGVIKKQLNLELLVDFAMANPSLSVVMVGPVQANHGIELQLDQLQALENVYFLGMKPLNQLPAYSRHLDVGLLPYQVNDYTNCIYPLKLHEYLASGIPVVSTPIERALQYTDVVSIASDAPGLGLAVQRELDSLNNGNSLVGKRQKLASQHDWAIITGEIADLIDEGLRDQ